MRLRPFVLIGFSVLALGACASKRAAVGQDIEKGRDVAMEESKSGFEDALLAPATDLNLRREEIPEILEELESPYVPVRPRRCSSIAREVKALTEVLGPDQDELEAELSRGEKLGKGAADLTLGTVEDASTSFIPFRSLVRRATGATAYEKKVRAAYQRGVSRRAYLKGQGKALGCKPPASPLPRPEKG